MPWGLYSGLLGFEATGGPDLDFIAMTAGES